MVDAVAVAPRRRAQRARHSRAERAEFFPTVTTTTTETTPNNIRNLSDAETLDCISTNAYAFVYKFNCCSPHGSASSVGLPALLCVGVAVSVQGTRPSAALRRNPVSVSDARSTERTLPPTGERGQAG